MTTSRPRTFVLAALVLVPFMLWAGRKATGPSRCDRVLTMGRLELAGSCAKADRILDEWGKAAGLDSGTLRDRVQAAVRADMLFIPFYVAAIGLACLAVGAAAGAGPRLRATAFLLATVPLLAGAFDYTENVALLRVLRCVSGSTEGWATLARGCALVKFSLIVSALVFVLIATAVLIVRRLRDTPEAWPLPLLLSAPLGNWALSYPVLVGVALLIVGIVWRGLLGALGIPDLYWHENPWQQLAAGIGVGLLCTDLGLIGFLLDAPHRWIWRFADEPRFPAVRDRQAATLVHYLLVTSGVIAVTAIASAAFVDVPQKVALPLGVVTGSTAYAFVAVALWRRTRLSALLMKRLPESFVHEVAASRSGTVGGGDLDGLAALLMLLRLVLLLLLVLLGGSHLARFTPALGICLLLSGLAALYGFFVFFFPARRFGVQAAFVLAWIATNGFGGAHHRIHELSDLYDEVRSLPAAGDVHAVAKSASGLAADDQVLDTWLAAHGSTGPLVVVAADGGGVRAATWILSVLTQLEADLPGFPERVRVIAGASGGMLGAAYYVASLQPPGTPGGRHRAGSDMLSREALVKNIARDSLTDLGNRLVLHDLLPLVNLIGRDRGDIIEEAWERQTGEVLSTRLRELQPGELAGWRPSLVLSPLIVEDGRRLLISNLELDRIATEATVERYLGRSALQFGRMFAGSERLKLSTAVRMNATFPYVMPAIELPTRPPLRTVDAGYYDEHGVDLAARWLLDHAARLREKKVRVILVEIPDLLAADAKSGPCNQRRSWVRSGLSGLTTPLEAILSGRDSATAHSDDELIETVASALNSAEAPDSFHSIAFEPPYATSQCGGCSRTEDAVPLNWYITSVDRERLAAGMQAGCNPEKLQQLKKWWDAGA